MAAPFYNMGMMPKEEGWGSMVGNALSRGLDSYTAMSNYYNSPEYGMQEARLAAMRDQLGAMSELRQTHPELWKGAQTGVDPTVFMPMNMIQDLARRREASSVSPEQLAVINLQRQLAMQQIPAAHAVDMKKLQMAPGALDRAEEVEIAAQPYRLKAPEQEYRKGETGISHVEAQTTAIPEETKARNMQARASLIGAGASASNAATAAKHQTWLESQGEGKLLSKLIGNDSDYIRARYQADKLSEERMAQPIVQSNPAARAQIMNDKWGSKISTTLRGLGNLTQVKNVNDKLELARVYSHDASSDALDINMGAVQAIAKKDNLTFNIAKNNMDLLVKGLTATNDPGLSKLANAIMSDFTANIEAAIKQRTNTFEWTDAAYGASNVLNRSLFQGMLPSHDPQEARRQNLRKELGVK